MLPHGSKATFGSVIFLRCWNPRKSPISKQPCYSLGMAKSKDPILLAKDFFDEFLSKADPAATPIPSDKREKAKAAGSLGGLKGGPARAKKLSPAKRKAIARKGAQSRQVQRSDTRSK